MTAGRPPFDLTGLGAAGFDLAALIDVAALPAPLAGSVAAAASQCGFTQTRQLVLVGQAGPRLWTLARAARPDSVDPIDDYSAEAARCWVSSAMPGIPFVLLYPGDAPVDLQALGRYAGWHHDSPFMVGVNARHGPWFAYRALLATGSDFAPSAPMPGPPPCASCDGRPCMAACPAGAVTSPFDLARCIDHRLAPASSCAATCLARCACPVGDEHRFPDTLLAHSYGRSRADLARYRDRHAAHDILTG